MKMRVIKNICLDESHFFSENAPLHHVLFEKVTFKSEFIGSIVFNNSTFFNTTFLGTTFACCDFFAVDFKDCRFINCRFRRCNMRNARFFKSSLKYTKFKDCNLTSSRFNGNLEVVEFTNTDFTTARFTNSQLIKCRFSEVIAEWSRFEDCQFAKTTFLDSSLVKAQFKNVSFDEKMSFNNTDLNSADFSGTQGLLSAAEWLKRNFKFDDKGRLIVYKAFGIGTYYSQPERWIVKEGSVITEVVNPYRTTVCGCGVNFGTLDWILSNLGKRWDIEIYECYIDPIDFADIVVPYNTDGKARCGRLTIGKKVEIFS